MSHKILVVDDEPQIRELLRRFLTKSGYEVTTVESGAEAIKKITDKSFSLVLSDVMMPGMDG
ncbi:MAG: response regulator, partial [Planctomycetes bacterium]|nr:response regulator [Planctomycetota bacterium]